MSKEFYASICDWLNQSRQVTDRHHAAVMCGSGARQVGYEFV